MNETLEYIDKYFNGELSPSERLRFEKQCETDQDFANQVAFYVSARSVNQAASDRQIKKEFNELNPSLDETEQDLQLKKEFDELYGKLKGKKDLEVKKRASVIKRMVPYLAAAAAACLAIFFVWQFFLKAPPAKQMAEDFIRKNIQKPVTLMGEKYNDGFTRDSSYAQPVIVRDKYNDSLMRDSDYVRHGTVVGTLIFTDKYNDSLARGKTAFYEKKYDEAERIFQSLVNGKFYGSEVNEYLGKVYLVTGKYEQAVRQFETLSQDTSLRVNYGSFYKAVTMMRRSGKGDVENAKKILEEVIRERKAGSKEARIWIEKL